jgi:hypothetical protein
LEVYRKDHRGCDLEVVAPMIRNMRAKVLYVPFTVEEGTVNVVSFLSRNGTVLR